MHVFAIIGEREAGGCGVITCGFTRLRVWAAQVLWWSEMVRKSDADIHGQPQLG